MNISDRAEKLFTKALALDPKSRAQYVADACGDNKSLFAEVSSLLDASGKAETYFGHLSGKLSMRALSEDEPPLAKNKIIGHWRILSLIGRGGMGSVYLAERSDEQFEHRAALKILPFGFDGESARSRFLTERQILARLVHDNIARLLDGGVTDDGAPYFVMDFVDGMPIDVYCNDNRLSIEQRLELFLGVAEAVEHAHRNLIVHRDIKPGNILVDASGNVKLLDFGVAKLLEPDPGTTALTRVVAQPMTLVYASPESVRGESVTTATDIYSLGVLLYVLLTGRYPYPVDDTSDSKLRQLICEHDAAPPSRVVLDDSDGGAQPFADHCATTPRALARKLAGDLDTIVEMALRKNPDQRYRTTEQLIADLRRYQNGLPIVAQAPSLMYRCRKFVRRHRAGVAAAAVAALALLTIAALASYTAVTTARQAQQITAERDKAEQINGFLLSIFELSSPNQTKGETVTALELLDRSAERVRVELADQPARQAVVMYSVAVVYAELSQFHKAEPLLQEATRLYVETGSHNGADFATTTELRAEILEIRGDYDEAEQLIRKAVAIRRELSVDEDLAVSLLMHGRIQHKMGMLDDAEGRYRESLSLLRASGERENNKALANNLGYLGSLLQHRGELESAELLHREALNIRLAEYGDEHIILIESYHTLGTVLMEREQYTDARDHFEKALAIERKLLPDGDAGAAFLYNGLGSVLERMGDLEQAKTNFLRSLEVIVQFFGEDHPNAGIVKGNLGRVLSKIGDHEQGASRLRDGIATLNAAAPNHRLLPGMRMNLGQCLFKLARYEEAEPWLLNAFTALEAAHGITHGETQSAVKSLNELYEAWGNTANADEFGALLESFN